MAFGLFEEVVESSTAKSAAHSIARSVAWRPMVERVLRMLPSEVERDAFVATGKLARAASLFPRYAKCSSVTRSVKYHFGEDVIEVELNLAEQLQFRHYFGCMNVALARLIDRANGGVFVDVGANFGFYTVLAARRFDRVVAFEPGVNASRQLRNNVELNILSNVDMRNVAVGACGGRLELFEHPLDSGLSRLGGFASAPTSKRREAFYSQGSETGVSYEVDVVKLDDALATMNGIALVKVDVEGFEAEVVAGGSEVLDRDRPVIFAETWDETVAAKIRCALPSAYRAWCPVLERETELWSSPDTVFSVESPF